MYVIKKTVGKILPLPIKNEIKIRMSKNFPFNQTPQKREERVAEIYRAYTGKTLDWNSIKTFSEKIQWMKLYYHHPDLSKIVCKYNFKKYIRKRVGEGYTVPLYGVWNDVKKINFDKLPEKFVLKSNCSSNGNFIKIIRNKSEIDFEELRAELRGWLVPESLMIKQYGRAYWDVRPLIIAEKYIEQIDNQVYDYKFFCFGGEPKFAYVATDHFDEKVNLPNHKISIYDMNWNIMPINYGEHPQNNIPAPQNFKKMIALAKSISKEFPFVRVDFFEIEEKVYFSELTFYPGGGLNVITPESFDELWGTFLELPEKASTRFKRKWF